MIRYEFVPDGSHILARLHAFLHKQSATATAVSGWFEVSDDEAMLAGSVDGVAEVDVRSFDFGNALLAATARRWIDEGSASTLRFELRSVDDDAGVAAITGDLSIGGRTETIIATAQVHRKDDQIAIEGTWPLSQRQFGLTRPAGVKDRVDIEFTLVAQRAS
ncbi:MAG: YceI family protein [Acidimicrobiales bacterium]|nr:YceI family protein [Acidimicrobiales bacterium]